MQWSIVYTLAFHAILLCFTDTNLATNNDAEINLIINIEDTVSEMYNSQQMYKNFDFTIACIINKLKNLNTTALKPALWIGN